MNEKVSKANEMTSIIEPQKPASVAQVELTDHLTAVINSSPLPPFIVEFVLKELYDQVRSIARQRYEKDKQEYENDMRKYEAQFAKDK